MLRQRWCDAAAHGKHQELSSDRLDDTAEESRRADD
jgi:hypothetical protein